MSENKPSPDLLLKKFDSRVALDDADRTALLSLNCRQRELPAGGYIVREFDRPGPCQVLVDGFAMRSKIAADGSRQILAIQLPGDALDLQPLYLDIADHNVQALTRCIVLEVEGAALRQVIEKRPNILRAFIVENAAEAPISREWLLNIGRRNAKARVAHLICEIAVRLQRQEVADMFDYVLPMTQEQLGDATGLTAVHINRMLKDLVEAGAITRSKNKITVADWGKLRSLADFNSTYLHLNRQVTKTR